MSHQALKEFVDKEQLTQLLIRQNCSDCREEDCANCKKSEFIDKLENQISNSAIEFMKAEVVRLSSRNSDHGAN